MSEKVQTQDKSNTSSSSTKQKKPYSIGRSIPSEAPKYKNSLSEKPKKHDAVVAFQDLLSQQSAYLLNAGVPQKQILEYQYEPWHYLSIVEATRFLGENITPLIANVKEILRVRSLDAWRMLQSMSPHHEALRSLKREQSEIKQAWKRRPRFREEKGRVEERGY
jgi:hypothetical protein